MPEYLCYNCGEAKAPAQVDGLTCRDCGEPVLLGGHIEMTFTNPHHNAVRLQGMSADGEPLECVETALTGRPSSFETAITTVVACMRFHGYAVAMPEPGDIKPYVPPRG